MRIKITKNHQGGDLAIDQMIIINKEHGVYKTYFENGEPYLGDNTYETEENLLCLLGAIGYEWIVLDEKNNINEALDIKFDNVSFEDAAQKISDSIKRDAVALGVNLCEDSVNHPSHYNQGKIEVIECIESLVTGEDGYNQSQAYLAGNVIKYLARAPFKGKIVEDLQKSKWYLERLISSLDE